MEEKPLGYPLGSRRVKEIHLHFVEKSRLELNLPVEGFGLHGDDRSLEIQSYRGWPDNLHPHPHPHPSYGYKIKYPLHSKYQLRDERLLLVEAVQNYDDAHTLSVPTNRYPQRSPLNLARKIGCFRRKSSLNIGYFFRNYIDPFILTTN